MSDIATITREAEAFYQAYIDGFNREDAAAFLGSFDYPHAFLSGEHGLLVSKQASSHQRFYQQTMTALHDRSWGRSGIDQLQIWPFSDALVMLVAAVTRYKKDESVLEKVRACYMIRRDTRAWKIVAFTEIKPPFSGPGVREESRTAAAETVVREAEAFYRAFIDGFNREDTDLYLRSFCYPNAMLSGERGAVVNAKESDQQRFYQEVMSSIQGRGWEHTGIDRLQAWPFADTLAMLVADITRYKKDGAILEKGRYCYTLRKDDGAWKILTLSEVKLPFPGPGAA